MSTITSNIGGTSFGTGMSMGLNSVLGIAQSGMQAAEAEMNVAANNIANLNTPGYQAQQADLVELSSNGVGDGVAAAGTSVSGPSAGFMSAAQSGQGAIDDLSNVDPAGQIVGMKQAQVLYDANAMVLSVGSQMIGTLIDVMNNVDGSNNSSGN